VATEWYLPAVITVPPLAHPENDRYPATELRWLHPGEGTDLLADRRDHFNV
jgi:hypothetical protein